MSKPLTDSDRRAFIDALDRAPFEVSDWEAHFIESVLKKNSRRFTQCQGAAIERMMDTYGERLGF